MARAEQWWSGGETAPLWSAVEPNDGGLEPDDPGYWVDGDGEHWIVRVDPRGVSWTAVCGRGPLRLDELPEEP